ncbi:MAG: DUF4145 domain-containing protein [Porticoccaceae bacterium]|nr:DUF4145 domain-containing protein [Porticoccaceae bacterium]
MAHLNEKEGSIVSHCPGCRGGRSTFEWQVNGREIGAHERREEDRHWRDCVVSFRLFKCAGCGMGAFGVIKMGGGGNYPGSYNRLLRFFPETKQRLSVPRSVPQGIVMEFREAETCLENQCIRAAAGLIRSVLDKTLRANGYKTKKESNLYKQIEAAAEDGVITQARKRRAHDEIRVLGNDVLHDDWHEIPEDDVEAARHYCQRILEDFYDDRESVLTLLREAGRVPEEDREAEASES